LPHNPLRDPRQGLGFRSSALDDLIHGWPGAYWTRRYALADGLRPRAPDPAALRFPDLTPLGAGGREKIRLCIATEDFVGPVNNGGIGTTYTHLAHLLAAEGHDVTVAYLRGEHTEARSIDHWVAFYAEQGIRFVPVPDTLPFRLVNADRWTRPALMLLDYLEKERFDLVHVSEWRGSGLYALIAKRLGLALRDTTIAVKTSSPWLWNRDYGLEAVGNTPDIFKMAMERRSVELADLVIGGSAHLLRWMASQGYRLPEGRTFVQPNVVVMGNHRGDGPDRGAHVRDGRIAELVFFGRLEARKGLEIFCEAVSLLDRDGLVDKVSFCGKPGARLPSHPTLETPDYIREVTRDWRAAVEIHAEFDNAAVIDFLCRRPCIAVMPSLIENSSLAVYETTQYGIPFLASDVGGNAELIAADDADRVLFQPRPYPLYHKLVAAARNGLERARPSFNNAANLATWRGFHATPAGWRNLHRPPERDPVAISLLVRVRSAGSSLDRLLTSIAAQKGASFELVLAADPELSLPDEVADWIAAHPAVPIVRVDAGRFESDAVALRIARAAARHPYLLLPYEGARLMPDALATLARAAATAGLDLATGFVAEAEDGPDGTAVPVAVVTPVGDDASYALFDRTVLKGDVLIRAQAFDALGGLSDEYKVGGGYGELVMAAELHGLRCEVVPRILSHRRSLGEAEALGYGEAQRELWRALRPIADSLPQAFKPMVMGLAGIAPRYAELHARVAKVNRDRAQLIEQRDLWKARAERASAKLAAAGDNGRAPAAPAVVPDGAAIGVFDIRDGVIRGWAQGANGAPATVTVSRDGGVLGSARADGRLSAFLPLPPKRRTCGFAVDLGQAYAEAEEAFGVDLYLEGIPEPLLRDLVVHPPATAIEQLGHDGSCENNKAGLIRGWVWRLDQPEVPVDVAFTLDGKLWRVEKANLFRQDLLAARKGTGAHGFSIPVPVARDAAPMLVEVRLAGTGLPLRRSPLQVKGRTVTTLG
jgi:glycosyltransferase involved in cell wall biosynthesis